MENQEPEIKRVGRTLAYKGSVVRVYKDDMVMPSGLTAQWDYFDHNGGAAVVPVLDDGRIIMIRQYRNGPGHTMLELPAGALDHADEPPVECAIRELEEETGYRCGKIEKLCISNSLPAFTNEEVHLFYATELTPTAQHLDEQEYLHLEYYSMDTLLQMIKDGEITDGKTLNGLLMYYITKF